MRSAAGGLLDTCPGLARDRHDFLFLDTTCILRHTGLAFSLLSGVSVGSVAYVYVLKLELNQPFSSRLQGF